MGLNSTCLTFSLKRRESEPSQSVLLYCLALFNVFQLHVYNHVHVQYIVLETMSGVSNSQ